MLMMKAQMWTKKKQIPIDFLLQSLKLDTKKLWATISGKSLFRNTTYNKSLDFLNFRFFLVQVLLWTLFWWNLHRFAGAPLLQRSGRSVHRASSFWWNERIKCITKHEDYDAITPPSRFTITGHLQQNILAAWGSVTKQVGLQYMTTRVNYSFHSISSSLRTPEMLHTYLT